MQVHSPGSLGILRVKHVNLPQAERFDKTVVGALGSNAYIKKTHPTSHHPLMAMIFFKRK